MADITRYRGHHAGIMIHSQFKIVLAAMMLAMIAVLAMAAPTELQEAPTGADVGSHHKKPQHSKTTGAAHHKITPHHSRHHIITTKPFHKHTTTTRTTTHFKPTHTPTSRPRPKSVGKPGQTGTIVNGTDFCLFLPPKFGGDISSNEDRAVAFCTKPNIPNTLHAQVLPRGFIKSAHFAHNKDKNWVQVTGRMDRSKYGLSKHDGGGQYDMRAPVGALCSGYRSFVQLTEPDAQIYCIRCCQNKTDCPVNKSTHGCKKVLGGNYA
ncbi:hypothetical protein EDD11_003387 [Mortierella claussenii]|nr:hypothetical protein EDD11_003387 [Mortierella claussenii]